ncbi:UNVERIFIED_CONTAM: hypothetical protein PYX00_011158 [Menopon gallinae]|uniref:Uncharacterized protein n=1 Tax=Menopon gallinae TaxID=328185 RepID=A0AAW2H673_9NEOP
MGEAVKNNVVKQENNSINIGLRASYEIDIWGKNYAVYKGAASHLKAQEEDFANIKISIVASMMNLWVNLMALREQKEILKNKIDYAESMLSLQQSNYTGGSISITDLLQQESQILEYKNKLEEIEYYEEETLRSINILCGKDPLDKIEIKKLDSSDYNIALSEAKVNYTKAEANYKRALGRSAQAEEELKLYEKNSGKKIKNSYLALRKPELEQAKSDLELAKSNLAKAKLNLDRTKIKAPYNLIVKEKNVSYVSVLETAVAIPIENAIADVDNLGDVKTEISDGQVHIAVEILSSSRLDTAYRDIENKVNSISSFPNDMPSPVISKKQSEHPLVYLMLYGEGATKGMLKEGMQVVRNVFAQDSETGIINIAGDEDYEIRVEVPESNLRKYNLTLEDIGRAIASSGIDNGD